MNKAAISVLGADRPGIIAAVSKTLFECRCNIEDVSQTILQTEFAGIFIASLAEGLECDDLCRALKAALAPLGLSVQLVLVKEAEQWSAPPSEPFVITTLGSDRLGLVAGMTELMARFGVNITNLKAVFRGGDDPRANIMIYEVDIPVDMDHQAFRAALNQRSNELGLNVSMQHRDIFEAIHRV